MAVERRRPPSLESLVESGRLGIEVLHPGGLDVTRELAERCHIVEGSRVLDVASGTGETVCYLAGNFGCQVSGVDISDAMVERAKRKAAERGLRAEFASGDAHDLPFGADTFDAVISECTLCLLDKERALREMVRVARPGGYVGIHDLCWNQDAPAELKQKLADVEGERPETAEGWKRLFQQAGLEEVTAVDKSHLVPAWIRDSRKQLGVIGLLKLLLRVVTTSGINGYRRLRESERLLQSEHMGYAIIVGRKP